MTDEEPKEDTRQGTGTVTGRRVASYSTELEGTEASMVQRTSEGAASKTMVQSLHFTLRAMGICK